MIKDRTLSAVPNRYCYRSILLLLAGFWPAVLLAQPYTPVTLSGFTADVIADGPSLAGSVTADADGTGYYFLNGTFSQYGTPTYFLPSSGLINSAATAGLTYQLAPAAGPNSLRLTATATSGTLTLASPQRASTLYLLTTSGSGASTIDVTVTFTDATTQVFSAQSVADWYTGTAIAIQGIGRVSNVLDGTATAPRLYQLALNISAANQVKQIASFTVTRLSGGITHIMGATISVPCTAPAAQPTALTLSGATPSSINGSFSAASPTADQYLVVRYAAGATPTAPVNGTSYTAGSALGAGTIVQAAAGTSFTATGLQPSSAYDFYVYALNTTNCIGPVYSNGTALTGSASTTACGGASGTLTVGPTGNYPTLTAALSFLGSGVGGPVVIELQPAYTSAGETFPITLGANPCINASNTLIIRPAAGATGLSIGSSNSGPTIDFAGARYVTLDGRPGSAGTASQLSVINTSATGAAVRIAGDAASDMLTYLDLQGQNTSNTSSALSGVVYIGTAGAGGNGNDNLVISNCAIHATAGGTPAIGLSAYGSNATVASYNDNVTLDANNIYDFFLANSASTGLKIDLGNNAWNITGNSFYQTATRTFTTAATHRALWVTPNVAAITNTAGGFTISGNFIGGSAPATGGNAWTLAGNIANIFNGMDISVGGGTATSIQNNSISNLALTTTSTGNSFIGISIANGNVNVGTATGNTIGSATTAGRITVTPVTSSGGTVWGIRIGSGNTVNIGNNTIGGFSIAGAGTISANFIGIGTGGGTTTNVTGNTIGGFSGSIVLGASSAATAQSATGISITNGTTTLVDGNTISYITNNYTGSGTGTTRGIVLTTSTSVISNNTIRNLSSTSPTASGGATSVLTGIAMTSTALVDVTHNTIHSLSLASASTTAAANITGIFFQGGTGAAKVTRNLIHSFEFSAANTSITITGIDYATGSATLANNMIRLGIKPDGTPLSTAAVVRGISSNSSSATNNFYFNSIYIGGTGVGSTVKNSYALIRTSTSGTYDIRNNILVNDRSNAGTGGKHYVLYFTTATTNAAPDYNIYRATGTGGVFAYNGTADVASYTAGWIASDIHSLGGDPLFVNATGDAASVNLHLQSGTIAEGAGIAIAAVTDDFDGDLRSGLTPTDIGADAANFTPVVIPVDIAPITLVSPIIKDCYSPAETVSIRIRNLASAALDFATTPVSIKVDVSGATTASFTQTISTGTLAAGDSLLVTFTPALNMSTAGTYSFRLVALAATDINTVNDTLFVGRTAATLSAGTVTAAPVALCTGGTPTLTLSGNSGGNVQWQEGSSSTGPWTNAGTGSATYTPSAPITTTTWYQAVVSCNTNTATTTPISVTVSTPQVSATAPATRCGSGTVTLGATASAGATLNWYAASSGGTAIGTGASFTTPSISASTTYYVEAAAAQPAGCVSSRVAVIAGVDAPTAITAGPQSLTLCPGSNASFSVSATGTALAYQWKKGTSNISGATSATLTIASISAADAGSYTVDVTGTCGTVTSAAATLSVSAANSWNGSVSTDWSNAANWCGGVPTSSSDVTIPSGTPFSPVVGSAADVRNLTILSGASVSTSTGAQFNIWGNIVNGGSLTSTAGTILFRGSTQQSVPALTAANVVINGSGGVLLTGNVALGNLQLQSGNLTLGANNLALGASTGGSLASHIITNGSGRVSTIAGAGTVTIPVGPDAASYNPVILANGQGIAYTVGVSTGITPAITDNSKAVNRTWYVVPATAPASPVSVTLQYDNAQGNTGFVPAGPLEAGYYSGTQWLLISPAGGLLPTGAATDRQVTVQTSTLGALVVSSPGGISYQTAVSSLSTEIASVQLQPNPARNKAVLRVVSVRAMPVQVDLRDAGGRLIRRTKEQLATGVNNLQLELSGISSGVYYLRLLDPGGKAITIAFIKG
jgi:hypothetical protein